MKQFKQALKFGSTALAVGLVGTTQVWAEADATVTAGISGAITNAGDTAKAVGILLITAMVIVMAVTWAMGMLRKGKNG